MIGGVCVSNGHLGSWPLSADLWRLSEKFDHRYVNHFLRLAGGHRLPGPVMNRIYHLGIPPEVVTSTLKSIRSLNDWSSEWVETAQQFLGNSRREISAGNILEAERARYQASMCYHIAQIMELRDLKTRDSCRAWAANLARLSLPVRNPAARHFTIPWGDRSLPVLFQIPEVGDGPFGLVVLLNGVSQSKEETFLLAPRFLEAGYAVMSIDSPGTGEATALGPINPNATDILDGVFARLRHESAIDLNRVVLAGASLGGNEAIRIARRIPAAMAVVAVTPAVQPARWMHHSSSILRAELRDVVSDDQRAEFAERFDAIAAAEQTAQPMLIFGAGHDMVVPPNESQRLAQSLGDRATYIWYPDLGHCLYAAGDQWSWEAATWIAAIGEARSHGITSGSELAAHGKHAIEQGSYQPLGDPVIVEEDFTEYARLLPADGQDS